MELVFLGLLGRSNLWGTTWSHHRRVDDENGQTYFFPLFLKPLVSFWLKSVEDAGKGKGNVLGVLETQGTFDDLKSPIKSGDDGEDDEAEDVEHSLDEDQEMSGDDKSDEIPNLNGELLHQLPTQELVVDDRDDN